MNKQEKEQLKNEIAMRDMMTKRIGKWSKYSLLAGLLFCAIAVWGFTGMHDNFLVVSDGVRSILKWIGLVIGIPSALFSALSFVSYRNSKKHVLYLIDKLQGKV